MNIIKISKYDIANGTGVRVVLWTSGCIHHCEGCHNPQTWDENNGREFTDSDLEIISEQMKLPYINGITFSGGDPLCDCNIGKVTEIAKYIRQNYPDKSIWSYTGYLYEDIKDKEIMKYLDVLVDGEFILEQRDIRLKFRGSRNQRVIDVKKSLAEDRVVLLDL